MGEDRNRDHHRKIFHKLVTLEEARLAIQKNAPREIPLGREEVCLKEAAGRILAEAVFSSLDLPPFDRAEMDGYAVLSGDVEGASDRSAVPLKLAGSIKAGDGGLKQIGKGECMEIATGAPLPRGADSVVMVEYTGRAGDRVEVSRGTTPGENVASVGSDVQIGEMVLREGTLLGVREVAVLAAVGVGKLEVFRRPKVGIISTGNEIVDVERGGRKGKALPFGKIYDVNAYALGSAVEEAGGIPIFLGRVPDDYDSVRGIFEEGLESKAKNRAGNSASGSMGGEAETGGCDLLLLSGGTSAGVGDLVYRVIEEVCAPGILVHGLNVKPGKPTIIAADKGRLIFGLPGYPVSALMIFDQLVRPYIERLGGRTNGARSKVHGKLAFRVNGAKGRRWFLPVHLIKKEAGGSSVYPIISSSGAIASLERADGYIIVNEDREFIDGGEDVEVSLFVDRAPELTIMGSHCPGLDLLLHILYRKENITAKTANIGSSAGIEMVARGEADIAGTHLLDEETMKYNEKFVKDAGLPAGSLVKGYRRLQGVIVAKGNPKKIGGIQDALRPELMLVNRNRGSGTRVLTDHLLRLLAEKEGMELRELAKNINGYTWEAKTHSAVAAAVHQGRADLGVGVKSVADAYGLDFIPLGYEEYDFVVNPESRGKDPVRTFLRCLRSDLFTAELEGLHGYLPASSEK